MRAAMPGQSYKGAASRRSACLEQVWGSMRVTPLLELLVGVHYHAAAHSRNREQLYIIATVATHHHAILRGIPCLLDLHDLVWSRFLVATNLTFKV